MRVPHEFGQRVRHLDLAIMKTQELRNIILFFPFCVAVGTQFEISSRFQIVNGPEISCRFKMGIQFEISSRFQIVNGPEKSTHLKIGI